MGLIAALAMHPDEKKVASAQGNKKCPECAEFVQPDAKVCRFCQHKFTEEEQPKTEAEQLAAAGIQAGPPCPKCGSVHTYGMWSVTKATHWWNALSVPSLHCNKCGEEWPDGSAPNETMKDAVAAMMIFLVLVAVVIAIAGLTRSPQQPANVPVSVSPVSPASVAEQKNRTVDQSTNSLDNVKTTTFRNDGDGGSSIIIRFRDSSLNIYVAYHPYEKVPETLEFEVGDLVVPKALLSAYDGKLRQDRAARQKAFQAAWQQAFDACMEAEE